MNPLTNVKNLNKMNQRELELGVAGTKTSWHAQYKDSAWIFVGGLPYDLTEGDILCIFSQYGEIVNINLVRDKDSGKSKGFCFICFEDQRSTILTVDNMNGIKVLGRVLRVDHVNDYKTPKEHGNEDEITVKLRAEGVAPKVAESNSDEEDEELLPAKKLRKEKDIQKKKKKKKGKKEKKEKKKEKKMRVTSESSDSGSSDSDSTPQSKLSSRAGSAKVKTEKEITDYQKHGNGSRASDSYVTPDRPREEGPGRDQSLSNRHSSYQKERVRSPSARYVPNQRDERNGSDRHQNPDRDLDRGRIKGRPEDRDRNEDRDREKYRDRSQEKDRGYARERSGERQRDCQNYPRDRNRDIPQKDQSRDTHRDRHRDRDLHRDKR